MENLVEAKVQQFKCVNSLLLTARILQIIIKLLEIQNRDLLDDAKFCGLLSTFVEDISGECWRPSEKKLLSELEKIRSTTTTSVCIVFTMNAFLMF